MVRIRRLLAFLAAVASSTAITAPLRRYSNLVRTVGIRTGLGGVIAAVALKVWHFATSGKTVEHHATNFFESDASKTLVPFVASRAHHHAVLQGGKYFFG